MIKKNKIEVTRSYQQQKCKKPIKDVVPVGEVSSPAKGKDLHRHLKQVVKDEAQVDNLKDKATREKIHQQTFIYKKDDNITLFAVRTGSTATDL